MREAEKGKKRKGKGGKSRIGGKEQERIEQVMRDKEKEEEEGKERQGETRRGKEEIVRNERREEREGPNAIEILQKVKLRPRTKNPTKTSPGAKSYKDAPPFCPRGPWRGAGGRGAHFQPPFFNNIFSFSQRQIRRYLTFKEKRRYFRGKIIRPSCRSRNLAPSLTRKYKECKRTVTLITF